MVLLQDSSELDGGEGPPHYQLDRAAVQPAEDAGANAGDKEDPELLQVGVAVQSAQHLLRGDESLFLLVPNNNHRAVLPPPSSNGSRYLLPSVPSG